MTTSTSANSFPASAKIVTLPDVLKAMKALAGMEGPPKLNLKQTVNKMQAELLRALNEKGFDYDSLAELLADHNIHIAPDTLQKYLEPYIKAQASAASSAAVIETPAPVPTPEATTPIVATAAKTEEGEAGWQPAIVPERELVGAGQNGARSSSRSGSRAAAATKTTTKQTTAKAPARGTAAKKTTAKKTTAKKASAKTQEA